MADTDTRRALVLQDAIEQSSRIISEYNPVLADCFLIEPWRRIDLAEAFARGFKDPPAFCAAIIRVAELDREIRQAAVTAPEGRP